VVAEVLDQLAVEDPEGVVTVGMAVMGADVVELLR
jgi:hypothetical protein